mmetsp:Transcript_26505/g.82810  ORF Transcript_26505/g.82810 Transcript_26505/m.82810 type:complete len:216 (-) Transcript_26505:59-706(-)
MSPFLNSRSMPFFVSCLIGFCGSFVATSNFLRENLGISQTKFSAPVAALLSSSRWKRATSCQKEMGSLLRSHAACTRWDWVPSSPSDDSETLEWLRFLEEMAESMLGRLLELSAIRFAGGSADICPWSARVPSESLRLKLRRAAAVCTSPHAVASQPLRVATAPRRRRAQCSVRLPFLAAPRTTCRGHAGSQWRPEGNLSSRSGRITRTRGSSKI